MGLADRLSRRWRGGIALLVALGAPVVHAQGLSWAEVLQALQHHPLVQGRLSAWRSAVAEAEGVAWQRYPTPSAEVSRSGSGTQQLWRLEQPLWNAGRVDASVSAAGYRAEAARLAVDEARRELLLRALAAWSEHARHTQRLQEAQRLLALYDERVAQTLRRVAQQTQAEADAGVARARRHAAMGDVLLSQQALQQSLTELSQLTGRAVTDVATALPDAAPRAPAPAATGARDPLQALAQSPTLHRLQAEIAGARAEADARRAARWPQLALRLERVQAAGSPTERRALLLLSYTPGAGLGQGAAERSAAQKIQAAQAAHDAAEREVRLQWQQTLNEIDAARARLSNAGDLRGSAAQVSESTQRQYEVGRKTWLDLLNALREDGQARLAWVDARHQLQLAQWRLQVLDGTLAPLASAAAPVSSAGIPSAVP